MDSVTLLAKMIDHSLLHPTMTDEQLVKGCDIAKLYNVASVCIKPYAVSQAVEWLKDSDVLVGTVIGFPHGNSIMDIKVAETVRACSDGAREIDMVVNIGKVLCGEWGFLGDEISAILEATHGGGAILKVIFENDYLDDEHIIKLCEICSEIGVEFAKTSTGYGFVKGENGKYSYKGATHHHLKLMRKHSDESVQIKAAGGVRTLDDLLAVKELGVTRVGATATAAILDEAKKRLG
jgi:deoxyribose-phosphate aldolase